ncbi:MAG: hypothetical protein MUF18_13295 [Fimbriiglobus sp.]|nr:hypothetical protein [Fimbriiglobus sp.]
MHRRWLSLKWQTLLLTLLGVIAIVVSVWWTYRGQIRTFAQRQQTLAALRSSPHAIDRDLGVGRIRVGMTVDELVAAHPPKSRTRHDDYDTLIYDGNHRRDSLRVIAVDGVVVYAGGTSERPSEQFAGGLSRGEEAAYTASILRWSKRCLAARMGLVGVAASVGTNPSELPTAQTDEPSDGR